ncbi:MAG: LptF/LptG family permease [Verrucomicrobiota bacterium]
MKLIHRYIFTSILKPLAFCLVSFFVLWLIYDLFDTLPDFVNRFGSAKWLIFKFYLVQLPKIAQSVIPVAFLFTTLYVLAYMSSHRELVVVQSNGMGLAEICWPFFLVACTLTAILFFLNFQLTPRAEVNRRMIKEQIQGKDSRIMVFENIIYRNPKNGTMWYLQCLDARKGVFANAEILILDKTGKDHHKLFAEQGEYQHGCWYLKNAHWIRFNYDGSSSYSTDMPQMTAYELTETPKQLVAALRPPDEMTWPELWSFLFSSHQSSRTMMSPYWTEHYYRIASPWVCIVLCFFGVALGVSYARKHVIASVFNCIFVLFALLAWQHFSLALGGGARIPAFIAGWNSVLVFGLIGFYLFAKRAGWVWIWHVKWENFQQEGLG